MQDLAAPLLPENWVLKDLDMIASLAPLQAVQLPVFEKKKLSVYMKRDDLLDPYINGNKVYKLHHFLNKAMNEPGKPLVSFGGAYSNHIFALAAAAKRLNLPAIGIIRGEEPQTLSPTLQDAKRMGMQLHFVSREEYQNKHTLEFNNSISRLCGEHILIPEGGAGYEGVIGCTSLARGILNSVDEKPDIIVHACGTGTSIAGLIAGLALSPARGVKILGVSVLKGYSALRNEIIDFVQSLDVEPGEWQLLDDFHCGGYAKFPEYLANFVADFEQQTEIMLDPVYTSKVMWAIVQLAEQDVFLPGTRIIVVHSGGLQGRRGFDMAAQVAGTSL